MKVFVAGGTGVIGRPTVRLLVESGHDVSVLVRTEEKAELVQRLGAAPVLCSLFDGEALRSALAGHDAAINLATHIPPVTGSARPTSWAENDRVRAEGSRTLVDAVLATGVGRYIQESIAFLYPDGGDRWLDEDEPFDDRLEAFSRPVTAAEAQAARVAGDGRVGVVLRFGMFHAAGSEHTTTMVRVTRWGLSPAPGDPGAYTPIIHIDDAARAVVAALTAPSGTYNIVDDEPLTRAGYADAWQRALDDPGRIRLLPAIVTRAAARSVPQLASSLRVSNRRFREATGWAPRYPSAAEALAEIVPAAREPRRVRSGPAALALLVLALASLLVGAWALLAPASFHRSFPGFGRSWVAPDGPFNEHLLRDVGGLNLALAVVTVVAVASMAVALVRAVAVAHLAFGVPHLLYHATHLHPFDPADRVAMVVSLAVPVVLAAAVLVLSGRRRPAGGRPVARRAEPPVRAGV